MKVLVVRDAFADYSVGAMIRDPSEIQAVTEAGQAAFCTVAEVDDAFFAEPEPARKGKSAPDAEA